MPLPGGGEKEVEASTETFTVSNVKYCFQFPNKRTEISSLHGADVSREFISCA